MAAWESFSKGIEKFSVEKLSKQEYPEYQEEVPPRSNELIDEYIRYLKGNRNAYDDSVPFHFFPQWAFPLISRSLRDLPISFIQIMNAGFKAEIRAPIPRNESIAVSSKLIQIEQKHNIIYFTVRVISQTKSAPNALTVYLTTLIRMPKDKKEKDLTKTTEDFSIPFDSTEIASFYFFDTTGFDYSILSGDINPIHWLSPYARQLGFKNVILHGFASSAFCIEALQQNCFLGYIHKLKEIEIKFTKPLILPAKPKLYIKQHFFYLGDSKLSRAYLVGNYKI